MKLSRFSLLLFLLVILLSCSSENSIDNEVIIDDVIKKDVKILSLGDSYTSGEGVCENCSYPRQLLGLIKNNLDEESFASLNVIAKTGWTTTDLINGVNTANPSKDFNIVTLLIGVNNQYQNGLFSLFEREFSTLVDLAIQYASGNKNNVIVISIPDYAYTPYGQNWSINPQAISDDIDNYNAYAKSYCETNGIAYVNVTDISRQGLENPSLVSSDQLHPSASAHSKMAERILPVALTILE